MREYSKNYLFFYVIYVSECAAILEEKAVVKIFLRKVYDANDWAPEFYEPHFEFDTGH